MIESQRVMLRRRLTTLIKGHCVSQAVACAAELGIGDCLSNGPRSTNEIADAIGCNPDRLLRLMNALRSIGIFQREGELWVQNEMSDLLRKDGPDSLWAMASVHGKEMRNAWGKLYAAIRDGGVAWDIAYGESIWNYFEAREARAAAFSEAMDRSTEDNARAMVMACDLQQARTVADIGGGRGAIIRAMLSHNQHMEGILLDRSRTIEHAQGYVENQRFGSRLKYIGGDMFRDIPSGIDVYIMSHILHDWEDEICIKLLRSCHRAMRHGSRLLIYETVVDSNTQDQRRNWSDLGVMIVGGRERSRAEYDVLLNEAQLRVSEWTVLPGGTLISATKVM